MKTSIPPPNDFLIVGQGIAGTLLAYFLQKQKQRIHIIDKPLPGATSRIAAGIINPVTGRRMAKSWRFEDLHPFAKKTYSEMGAFLGINCWKDTRILRALPGIFEENEWLRRSAWPEHEKYMMEEADLGSYRGKIKEVHAWGELSGTAQVSLSSLITAFRDEMIRQSALTEQILDYHEIVIMDDGVNYKENHFKKVIFCEGARAVENPYFNYLPFTPTKGELLLVRIPGVSFEKLLKNKLYIAPLEGDLYWIGSTSRFEYAGPEPTERQFVFLKTKLEQILDIPYEIVDHLAGIRPTVKDKRPLIGLHPRYPSLAVFNGLGTKGASLGPYFAHQMANFLMDRNELDPEVCISRFS